LQLAVTAQASTVTTKSPAESEQSPKNHRCIAVVVGGSINASCAAHVTSIELWDYTHGKDSVPALFISGKAINPDIDSKFELSGCKLEDAHCSLVVHNVQLKDAGRFSCRLQSNSATTYLWTTVLGRCSCVKLENPHSRWHRPFLPARRYVSAVLAVIVRPSVSLSVTRRYCVKTAKRTIMQTMPRDIPNENCAQSDPPTPFRTQQLRPISAHSLNRESWRKKVQLALIGIRPRAFQRAIDEPCKLPLSPQSVAQNSIAVIASKIQRLSKEVCYEVSLCENFQRQSCSYTYIIPLSNGP